MLKGDFPDLRSPDLTRSYSSAAVSYLILACKELESDGRIYYIYNPYLFDQQFRITGLSLICHAGLLPVFASPIHIVGKLHEVFVHLMEVKRKLESIVGDAVMNASRQVKRMGIGSLATVGPSDGLVCQAA